VCGYVKRFVDHRYFSRGILLAILINTLSMGIEYHNQVCLCDFHGNISESGSMDTSYRNFFFFYFLLSRFMMVGLLRATGLLPAFWSCYIFLSVLQHG